MSDVRDQKTWAIVELSRLGEQKVENGTLEILVRQDLQLPDDVPIFIPARTYRRDSNVYTLYLLSGYIFIGSVVEDVLLYRLENLPYISQVISHKNNNGLRVLKTLPNSEIEKMRQELRSSIVQDFPEGSHVNIVDGMYRNFDGKLMQIIDNNAVVHLQLRTLEAMAVIPLSFLEVSDV
jgi:transcription antitermination factor NusG